MVDGYYFASSVGHVLDNKRKPFDFAMIGCHREDNTFKSMKIEPYKVYIREIDETFLHENRTRPMLLLDDTCATGKTIGAVLNYMIKIDCTNIFLASQSINYTPEGFALADPAGGVGLYKAK
jgi:uracil phosphoribosyltransferase